MNLLEHKQAVEPAICLIVGRRVFVPTLLYEGDKARIVFRPRFTATDQLVETLAEFAVPLAGASIVEEFLTGHVEIALEFDGIDLGRPASIILRREDLHEFTNESSRIRGFGIWTLLDVLAKHYHNQIF